MSKIFYDHLIVLPGVEVQVKAIAESEEERNELWKLVDEIVHHKVLEVLLDELAEEHHEEFLEKFQKAPHDENLLDYLIVRAGSEIEDIIRREIGKLEEEIVREIGGG